MRSLLARRRSALPSPSQTLGLTPSGSRPCCTPTSALRTWRGWACRVRAIPCSGAPRCGLPVSPSPTHPAPTHLPATVYDCACPLRATMGRPSGLKHRAYIDKLQAGKLVDEVEDAIRIVAETDRIYTGVSGPVVVHGTHGEVCAPSALSTLTPLPRALSPHPELSPLTPPPSAPCSLPSPLFTLQSPHSLLHSPNRPLPSLRATYGTSSSVVFLLWALVFICICAGRLRHGHRTVFLHCGPQGHHRHGGVEPVGTLSCSGISIALPCESAMRPTPNTKHSPPPPATQG
jgi:hypothetical protein